MKLQKSYVNPIKNKKNISKKGLEILNGLCYIIVYYYRLLERDRMKIWKNLKKWLAASCVCFTAITMFMILLPMIGSYAEQAINAKQVLRTFPCSLCLGAAWWIWWLEKPARWGKILLHYSIHVLSIFLFLYLPVSLSGQPAARFLMLVLLSVIYWVIFGIIALIRSRIRVLKDEGR